MKPTVLAFVFGSILVAAILAGGFYWLLPNDLFTICTRQKPPPGGPNARIRICTAVIESNNLGAKDLAEAYYRRALGYEGRKQFDYAFTDYNKSISLNPNDARVYVDRGNIHLDKGRGRCAIADFERARKLAPKFMAPYNNLGSIYDQTGNYDRAIASYSTAIKLDPDSYKTFFNRGNAYWHRGQHDKAIADYGSAISINQKYARAFTGRGALYLALGQLSKAEADLRKALDLNPKSGWANITWKNLQICKTSPESRHCNRCGKWPDSPGCIGTRRFTPPKISMAAQDCG
jgi:tetratricopeptide (TPR) repeat protein